MLIRFRVSNFRSLRDEQELSMVAAFKDGRKDLVHIDALGLDLLRVAGIYGANAAGKSNVLEALRFMREAVIGSHRAWPPDGPIPRETFLLNGEGRTRSSFFEMDFMLEGVHFQYGFELDDKEILREWLYAFPNKRRQIWFTRDTERSEPFQFGKQLKGSNRAIEKLTRRNSLFLSAAAENAHEALGTIYSWFRGRLYMPASRDTGIHFTTLLLETKRNEILQLVRLADLGIIDIRLKDKRTGERRGRALESGWAEGANRILEFSHKAKGDPVSLTLAEQSRGTQAWFSIAGLVVEALGKGALLCLDEIDASLHPYLVMEIIRIFKDAERNSKYAQLIFNTHDTTLLGHLLEQPGLHRDQIWFVEKDEEGASQLYPLSDFKPRKFENVERGYLQGRYGAIPFIGRTVIGEDA
ncbi:MAG TPA: ATP-binding protein [Thermoanaerobaculia bacterium]|nr:ATP-binding protein [Thermoanaerobaculia bacterium]